MIACEGKNCGCTDGISHSLECQAEYAATIAGERFVKSQPDDLRLQGKATDHIWIMEDGEEPNIVGIRMDCGDSGVVYLTRDQTRDLQEQLADYGNKEPLPKF